MNQQTIYICVGLPGSGKSTHSKVVELTSHYAIDEDAQVIRINQDALGSRGACNDLATYSVRANRNLIIDRCNVSIGQRKFWIELAKRNGYKVVVELFRTDPATCLARCNYRTDHETMTNPAKYRAIIAGFRATWQEPSFDEGIDVIHERDASGKILKTRRPPERKPGLWQRIKRLFL